MAAYTSILSQRYWFITALSLESTLFRLVFMLWLLLNLHLMLLKRILVRTAPLEWNIWLHGKIFLHRSHTLLPAWIFWSFLLYELRLVCRLSFELCWFWLIHVLGLFVDLQRYRLEVLFVLCLWVYWYLYSILLQLYRIRFWLLNHAKLHAWFRKSGIVTTLKHIRIITLTHDFHRIIVRLLFNLMWNIGSFGDGLPFKFDVWLPPQIHLTRTKTFILSLCFLHNITVDEDHDGNQRFMNLLALASTDWNGSRTYPFFSWFCFARPVFVPWGFFEKGFCSMSFGSCYFF